MTLLSDLQKIIGTVRKDHPYKSHRSRSGSNMAKGKKSKSRSHGGFGKLGGFLRNPTLMKVALGLGFGTIGALAASKFSPNNTQLVSLGAAYLGGGIEGAIGAELVKAFAGAPSILGNIFGGGGMTQSTSMTTMTASQASLGWA